MGYKEHKQKAPQSVNCAVLTISDTRTEQDDDEEFYSKGRKIVLG